MEIFPLTLIHMTSFDLLSRYWQKNPEMTILGSVALIILLILLFALIFRFPEIKSHFRAKRSQVMEPVQVEELMTGNPPCIIDLRTHDVFLGKVGHIRGSLNIPFAELRKRIHEVAKVQGKPIVLVDDCDELSHLAFPIILESGHTWVYVLKGGLRAWKRAKLPLYHP